MGIELTKITGFMDLVGQTSTSVDQDWQRIGYGRKTLKRRTAYPLMGRTSLRAMYLMLPDFDRTVIDAILGDGHVAYQGVRNYLFGSTDPDEIIIASEALGMGTSQVKLSDLAKSFAAKKADPMSRFSGISELGVGAGKLETYGMSRPTDIGHDTDDTRVEGAVMEMRALGGNVEPDRWAEVTASVLAIIRGINT